MKKSLYLIILLLTAILYVSSINASQEDEENESNASPTGDEIVTMCEGQFTIEAYSDDEERNNLIDQCINDNIASKEDPREES